MIIEGPDSLRVVDPAAEAEAGRFERGWAIVLFVLAACDAVAVAVVFGPPSLGRAPFGLALDVDRFIGVVGVVAAPIWLAFGLWMMRAYRARRATWTYDSAAPILWPDEIDVADGDPVPYRSLEAIVVDENGAQRTITLRTRDGRRIRCALAFLDDADFTRVIAALEHRVADLGVRVEDSRAR